MLFSRAEGERQATSDDLVKFWREGGRFVSVCADGHVHSSATNEVLMAYSDLVS